MKLQVAGLQAYWTHWSERNHRTESRETTRKQIQWHHWSPWYQSFLCAVFPTFWFSEPMYSLSSFPSILLSIHPFFLFLSFKKSMYYVCISRPVWKTQDFIPITKDRSMQDRGVISMGWREAPTCWWWVGSTGLGWLVPTQEHLGGVVVLVHWLRLLCLPFLRTLVPPPSHSPTQCCNACQGLYCCRVYEYRSGGLFLTPCLRGERTRAELLLLFLLP